MVQVFYIYINVLAEVQGSFTFSPQQMPHASTYIQNTLLEFTGEKPLLSGVCRSCGCLHFSDLDGGIGANKVYRNFIASLMVNKRDVVAFILSIWDLWRVKVAQINKLYHILQNQRNH
jgi:hypothetical protein